MCPQSGESPENPGSLREHLSCGGRSVFTTQDVIILKYQMNKVKLRQRFLSEVILSQSRLWAEPGLPGAGQASGPTPTQRPADGRAHIQLRAPPSHSFPTQAQAPGQQKGSLSATRLQAG